MRDPNGISRGSGFVAFSTAEEASRALTDMNGKMVASNPFMLHLHSGKKIGEQGRRHNFHKCIQLQWHLQ